MNSHPPRLPPLEPRFLPPESWRAGWLTNPRGQKIRYGHVAATGPARGTAVILPGLSEFCEKYFETMRDLQARGLNVYVIDWRGQGLSDRHLENTQRRHSDSFDNDIADLHQLITEHVIPESTAPDGKTLPLVMIGHSMGGNLGLRYLADHPGVFACAGFTAPMMGIKQLEKIPMAVSVALTGIFSFFAGKRYVFGGGEWTAESRARPGKNIFSSDPERDTAHNAWCLWDKRLQIGNVTFRWLYEAVKSCALLQKKSYSGAIQTPCVAAIAGTERLVDNHAARRALAIMPHMKVIELRAAKHEILMETDQQRNKFLAAFDELVNATIPAPRP